ncbi:MAG: TonB-dependent receptor [Bacteroidia bacterium]
MQKNYLRQLLCTVLLGVSFTLSYAQNGSISGTVVDEKNETLPGVSIVIQGTTQGSSADMDGKYRIASVAAGKYIVVGSYIGYTTVKKEITVAAGENVVYNFSLKEDVMLLNEAVAIGYGTVQKKDLTGTVSSVGAKDFNKGTVTSPEQLISGKVSGVQITSNGGAPGSGSRIRIRGGTSLNASNDPLIVIDGVPLDNNTVAGSANPLSLINPNEIENITVLKDASAAAIYGSRGANGVIIVTTKKGAAGKFKVEFNTQFSYSQITDYTNVLSADEFIKAVKDSGTTNQKKLLNIQCHCTDTVTGQEYVVPNATKLCPDGTAPRITKLDETDWQKEVFRDAISSDNNLSFSGGIKNLPYRVSLGVLSQNGILQRSQMDRYSVGLNLNPSFFKNQLEVEINTKYSQSVSQFTDQGSIGSAISFDPVRPVYSDTTTYGGYFEWLNAQGNPNTLAARNPVGLIYQKDDKGIVDRFTGNVALDYKLKWVPGLKAHLNLGTDLTRSHGNTYTQPTSAAGYLSKIYKTQYKQDKDNQLIEFYLNYTKDLNKNNKIEVTAGYSYQHWQTESPSYPSLGYNDTIVNPSDPFPFFTENALLSYYGRLIYTFKNRWILTATLRNDNSSRFSPETRSGLFPSAALAYRISDEPFLSDVKWLSNLKIRVGYGVTGQQDISNDYPYIANYSQGTNTAQYQFDSLYYYVLRPDAYVKTIKWEETATSNIGLDFGFMNGRINGSVDFYIKNTKDLLVSIAPPAGTNFNNNVFDNIGKMENKGVEINVNYIAIAKEKVTWEIGVNFTTNKGKITKLLNVQEDNFVGIKTGAIDGGVGNNIQVQTVGYAPNSFYVYHQLYDDSGKPMEGKYQDINGDGIINDNDLYRYKKPDADFRIGLNTSVTFTEWTLSMSFRSETGNYVYNNVNSVHGNLNGVGSSALSNLSTDYNQTLFKKEQYYSDYYVKDASFVKMDYLSLAYNFKNVIKGKVGLTASINVQNVFTVTDYSGLDPEIAGGIDKAIYPRPRVYSLGLNFQF